MTDKPSDRAIAQAFWEWDVSGSAMYIEQDAIVARARTIDAQQPSAPAVKLRPVSDEDVFAVAEILWGTKWMLSQVDFEKTKALMCPEGRKAAARVVLEKLLPHGIPVVGGPK